MSKPAAEAKTDVKTVRSPTSRLKVNVNDPNVEWSERVTIIGSGQIAAVMAFSLTRLNSKLLKQGKKPVKISILGRNKVGTDSIEESDSIRAMKSRGIKIYYDEGRRSYSIDPDEIFFTTNQADIEANKQDHIIITTKAFDHDEDVLNKIKYLRKEAQDRESATTVMFAQNGIPCWFMNSIRREDIELKALKGSKYFLEEVGIENIVGCILNVACNVKVNPSTNIPVRDLFNISTPLDGIEFPMDFVDGIHAENLGNLKNMFLESGIKVQMRGMDLRKELLLKLQVNAAINGICAITGNKVGEVMGDRDLSRVALAAAQEIDNFARRVIIGIELRDESKLRGRLKNSANHYPSMERDFSFGNKLETKQIYEAPVEISEELRLPPMNVMAKIADILNKMESYRDEVIKKNLDLDTAVQEARNYVARDLEKLKNMAKQRYRAETPPKSRLHQEPSLLDSSFMSVSSSISAETETGCFVYSDPRMIKIIPETLENFEALKKVYISYVDPKYREGSPTNRLADMNTSGFEINFKNDEVFESFKKNIKNSEQGFGNDFLLQKVSDAIEKMEEAEKFKRSQENIKKSESGESKDDLSLQKLLDQIEKIDEAESDSIEKEEKKPSNHFVTRGVTSFNNAGRREGGRAGGRTGGRGGTVVDVVRELKLLSPKNSDETKNLDAK